ncbi:hypothetical protein EBZ57_01860 [bacterium]|nr:hypothetical protein [bacterium]
MEFPNRGTQPAPAPVHAGSKKFKPSKDSKLGKILTIAVAIVVAGLIIFAIATMTGANGSSEKKLVNKSKLQAVFLNTGQVYFGKITQLNSKYLVVTNIYYLQSANANGGGNNNAQSNLTLIKLGCELHEPYDQMTINRDQVTFWENLQDNGQVAKAVSTWVKQNPNGQKCTDQSNSSPNTSNTVQKANQNGSTNP